MGRISDRTRSGTTTDTDRDARKSSRTVPWSSTRIKALEPPDTGRDDYHHPEKHQLVVRVSKRTKVFYVTSRVQGHQRRMRLGSFPTMTPQAALELAKPIIADIDRGLDPTARKRAERGVPTLAAYWKTFDEDHVATHLRPNSRVLYRGLWRLYLEQRLGAVKLSRITRADVKSLHSAVKREVAAKMETKGRAGDGGRTANCVVNVLRVLFNHAIDGEILHGPNPAVNIKKSPEGKRDRYLTHEEASRLFAALEVDVQESGNWDMHDVVKALLLSGQRKSNVLGARWSDIDLATGRWLIPASATKTSRPYLVHLHPALVEILAKRKDVAGNNELVFPFVACIRQRWNAIKEHAQLDNLTMHDLRHAHASFLAQAGYNLQIIGQALGHASVTTTQRYAHLLLDNVSQAINTALTGIGAKDNRRALPVSIDEVEG